MIKISRKQKSIIRDIFNNIPTIIKCFACNENVEHTNLNGWDEYKCKCGFEFCLQIGFAKKIIVNNVEYDVLWGFVSETLIQGNFYIKYKNKQQIILEYYDNDKFVEHILDCFIPFDISQARLEKLLLLL